MADHLFIYVFSDHGAVSVFLQRDLYPIYRRHPKLPVRVVRPYGGDVCIDYRVLPYVHEEKEYHVYDEEEQTEKEER